MKNNFHHMYPLVIWQSNIILLLLTLRAFPPNIWFHLVLHRTQLFVFPCSEVEKHPKIAELYCHLFHCKPYSVDCCLCSCSPLSTVLVSSGIDGKMKVRKLYHAVLNWTRPLSENAPVNFKTQTTTRSTIMTQNTQSPLSVTL